MLIICFDSTILHLEIIKKKVKHLDSFLSFEGLYLSIQLVERKIGLSFLEIFRDRLDRLLIVCTLKKKKKKSR
jgi:hypothetical protein